MSTSEEYLDSLLKAIMEGNSNEEPSLSTTQDVTEEGGEQESLAPEEPDTNMSMDDIEEVFVSLDADTAEEDTEGPVLTGDGMLSDEQALDDGILSGGLSVDEGLLSDEFALDETMLSDEYALNEETVSDEMALGHEAIPDELALIEPETNDFVQEESMEESVAMDDLGLDELGLGDLGSEDLGFGETEQYEPETSDVFVQEEAAEVGDDFTLEDVAEEDDGFAREESMEESAETDDLGFDELGLGDLESEDLGDAEQYEPEADDAFALEETGEDDADLSALLASMGADDDLSEINDLLEKSDQGEVVDDDIMAMLGEVSSEGEDDDSLDFLSIEGNLDDIREITPEELADRGDDRKWKQQKKREEKERKKREKQAKKAENKNGSQDKKGILVKFLDFLLEEDEEGDGSGGNPGDGGAVLGSVSEENQQLLDELKAEDKKQAKKKDKKEKKAKKDKKGKAKGGDGEEKAGAKPKKPKKEKKEKKKKEKIEEEPQVPEKKLSKKKVVSVFIFCATIAACIVVVTILLPEQLEKQEARVAFDQSQYTQVYGLFYGKELNEEDEVLMQKSSTILKLQRKLDSYENYVKMDMPLEALDALLDGVSRYQILTGDAELYNVNSEVAGIYRQILDILADYYGLSEADALDIIASEDDITYSRRVQAVISGESFGMDEPEPASPEEKQDVLPEEEEIIDRLEDIETE